MKILLHTCCGPCTIFPLKKLREKDHEVFGYFYNPNIHPFTEWDKRKETLLRYAGENDLQIIAEGDYDLELYLREVVHRESRRCFYCYSIRLQRTARMAKRGKFDAFSTTLLVSPYQKHDLIKEIGEIAASETGIPFYYEDFRQGYKEATDISRRLGMYRQQYCGCIFSERDRYRQAKRKK